MRTTMTLLSLTLPAVGAIGFAPAAAWASPVTILESNAERLVVRVESPQLRLREMEAPDGRVYMAGTAEGFGEGAVGQPGVPVLGSWILIPNGRQARITAVEADSASARQTGGVLLEPTQPPLPDLEDAPLPPFAIDESSYGRDTDYPGSYARLDEPQMMRGQACALLWLHPYQYNPVARRLTSYPSLTVTISFEGELAPIPAGLASGVFDKMLLHLAINGEAVLGAEREIARTGPPTLPAPVGWDYLILSHPNFVAAANKLAAWKQQEGYKTLVTSLPSGWKAADIEKALLTAYQTWDVTPQYLLLIGDAEYVPTDYRRRHVYDIDMGGNSQGYTGTDLYYSTLHATTYTDPGKDVTPDILVGRLSVDTAAQAMERVDSIIAYEKDPPLEWPYYETALVAANFADGGSASLPDGSTVKVPYDSIENNRFVQTADDVAAILGSKWVGKTVRRAYRAELNVTPLFWNDGKQDGQTFANFDGPMFGSGTPVSTVSGPIPLQLKRSSGFAWNADKTDVTDAIEAGSFLVFYRGHGSRDHWAAPRFDRTDVSWIVNNDLQPVVWSLNCETGWFDNETDFKLQPGVTDLTLKTEESFSEAWERQPGHRGAVGIIAPSRITYSGPNDRLAIGMTEAIWPDPLTSFEAIYEMAAVMNLGKEYMWMKGPQGNVLVAQQEAYHWFGDPSMQIRTKMPALVIADFDTHWPWLFGPHPFEVQVTQAKEGEGFAGPLPGARVAVSRFDHPQEQWIAATDAEGRAVFPELRTRFSGEYQVTVTAANAVPFVGELVSGSGPAAGVAFDAGLYACEGEVGIRLADLQLEGQPGAEVTVRAESGDSVRAVLHPLPIDRGVFEGVVASAALPADPEDRVLQVRNGDTIRVEYLDPDDGTGVSARVEDAAVVRCSLQDTSGLLAVPLTAALRRW